MAYFLTAEYSSVFKIEMFAKNKAPYANILPSYGNKSKPPKNLSFNKKHRRSVNFYDLLIFSPYKDILPPSSIWVNIFTSPKNEQTAVCNQDPLSPG